MSSYGSLAQWYDQLTSDVPYIAFADLYEREFIRDGGEFKLLLDLCCGTGTLTWELARRGYEMIGVDSSVDMLMQARQKGEDGSFPVQPPLFLCQDASELDLYGTVDAAVCSLDAINYLPPDTLPELFKKLRLFIRPGGLFIFDLRSPQWLESMDGQIYVDEQEDVFCMWRSELDREEQCITYGMDLFTRKGNLWRRECEEHTEYIHCFGTLCALLENEKFCRISLISDAPQTELGRQFIIAKRTDEQNG